MPQPQRVDPIALVASFPPGSALAWPVRLPDSPDGQSEIAILIREDAAHIAKLPASIEVAIRSGLHIRPVAVSSDSSGSGSDRSVIALAIVVGIAPYDPESIYETWINEHADGPGGSGHITRLATQSRIPVAFIGDSGEVERSIAISNQLKEIASRAVNEIAARPRWSMAEFDALKAAIESEYATVWDH